MSTWDLRSASESGYDGMKWGHVSLGGWYSFILGEKVTFDEPMGTFSWEFTGTVESVTWTVEDGERITRLHLVGAES